MRTREEVELTIRARRTSEEVELRGRGKPPSLKLQSPAAIAYGDGSRPEKDGDRMRDVANVR